MSKYEPERVGSRLLDGCVAVLLGSMALYGAVQIIQAIWLPLCLLFAVVGCVWLAVMFWQRRW